MNASRSGLILTKVLCFDHLLRRRTDPKKNNWSVCHIVKKKKKNTVELVSSLPRLKLGDKQPLSPRLLLDQL